MTSKVDLVRPADKARETDRWTEIIFRALSNRVARRWRFVSFRGNGGREWRGIVDLVAIRKSTADPQQPPLQHGDLFDLVLIQMKGGSARAPSLRDRERLHAVSIAYNARAVVLFEWSKGRVARFSVLNAELGWEETTCAEIFGK